MITTKVIFISSDNELESDNINDVYRYEKSRLLDYLDDNIQCNIDSDTFLNIAMSVFDKLEDFKQTQDIYNETKQ